MTFSFPVPATSAQSTGGIATATRHVFPNGVVALIQRNSGSPTVRVQGSIRVGAVNETAEAAGLAVFTGAALIRGTHKRTYQQIVAETEERGCSVNAAGGVHSTVFGGKALAEDLPLVIEVLHDMIQNPIFPDVEIEKLRGQFLMGLRESEQETRTRAMRAIRAQLYPPEHPYSRLSSGSIETVKQISRDDIVTFHQLYHPAATTIAVVGDIEPEAVIAELERTLGSWHSQGTPVEQPLPDVPPIQGIQRSTIAMPGKVQADVVWSVHGLARNDPDYYAAQVGNMILGRLGMGGRLSDNVRDNQGMAYYVYSNLDSDLGAGPWLAVAGINPANVDRAIEAIIHEIEQFKAQGPTDEELSDARAYMTGSLVLGLETNDGIASSLLAIERYGLGLDYIDRYPSIINAVTHAEIVTVARKYLSTDRYVLVTAGPVE